MKKLVVVFLLLSTIPIVAQDYKPLLDYYNEWHLRYCFVDCSTDIYYTNGDTIVDNTSYKILDGYHYISRTFLLREEVAEQKVYLRLVPPGGDSEYLLYDFSLKVGDSMDMKNPLTPFPENAGYYRLDSIIPRPLVDGNDYRHYYFSPTPSNPAGTNNAIWVEGAGSLSLINAPSGDPSVNSVGRLGCMYKSSIPFYTDFDIMDTCEPTIVLNVDDIENPFTNVKLISNLTTGTYQIINTENVSIIKVYDIIGKEHAALTNRGNNSVTLDLSHYKSGIYLVSAYSSEFERKIILKIVVH
ncbi:T9SS type A sorting domain-containing protein [Ulvibacter sp. MAR_2010_11]|uniref:T9SS type A sorting domain-containing protein n=1 Tax=Ulvibacter sp. MAR_2010_11 TaxID=1250229 RepID=UPI0012FD574C|nr:T9SS type A sorting domain-containing protein [Ulvibacter sp. MAR_2010_11]